MCFQGGVCVIVCCVQHKAQAVFIIFVGDAPGLPSRVTLDFSSFERLVISVHPPMFH